MFSVQKIYNDYGKFDKVVVITFMDGSISEGIYGKQITGQFHYTHGDRLRLEKNEYVTISSPAKARFNILIKRGYNSELIDKTSHVGIIIEDIKEVFTLPREENNLFKESGIRSLPEPITVEYSGTENMDLVSLGFYKRRMEDNQELLEYELDRYAALMMVYKPERIDTEFSKQFILDENGDPKKSVLFEKCSIEYISGHIDEITEEHHDLMKWKFDWINRLVVSELKRVGIQSNKELYEFLWLHNFLHEFGIQFTPEILLFGPKLIYLDLESWLHIFLKHAKPLMQGKHVQSRTPFQYALNDIFMLLQHIINQIKDEIEKHYREKGQVEFTKRGIYFQGDYYTVKISSVGRIETIYKQGNR